jgi:hypothetical protein
MDDARLAIVILAVAGVIGLAIRIGLAIWFSRLPERWGKHNGLELVERGPLSTTRPHSIQLKYKDRASGRSIGARMVIRGWWSVRIDRADE